MTSGFVPSSFCLEGQSAEWEVKVFLEAFAVLTGGSSMHGNN